MNPLLKRALLITGFALIVVGFFFVIFLVFFRSGDPVVDNTNGGQPGGNLPIPGNGNINRSVTDNVNSLPFVNGEPVTTAPSTVAQGGPTLTTTAVAEPAAGLAVSGVTGNLQYYDRTTGKFYQLSPDGTTRSPLTDAVYPDVESIAWSPDGAKAILGFPDDSKVLYDFTQKKQTTLPRELNDFSWSPDSQQLVSKFLDERDRTNQWLMVTKPDGSQAQTAEHLGENANRVTTAWSPNNQIIATYQKSVAANQSQILFLGAAGENLPSVNIEGRGFVPKWSPDGRRLLYSAYGTSTDNNPRLYIMDGSADSLGRNNLDLGLTTTADKCVFSQNGYTLYCAVPYYMNPGSGPQPSLSQGIPDNLYSIDLIRGVSTLIARPVDANREQRFSASDLRLSADESLLFFTDSQTGTIQRVQLR